MDPMIVQYALFIFAALLIIGAVIMLNRWLYRHNRPDAGSPDTWARLDVRRPEAREEIPASELLSDEDDEEAEIHVRAKQNGHSNGHKPLM
jgi:hypothetical protein